MAISENDLPLDARALSSTWEAWSILFLILAVIDTNLPQLVDEVSD